VGAAPGPAVLAVRDERATTASGAGAAPGPGGVGGGDGAPDHDIRAVLAITPFRRLWLALAGSSFGDWLGLLATAALAQELASSSYAAANFAVAGVFMTRLAPAVVLGPFAGAIADRLNRRVTLVLGDFLRFVLFASIPIVRTLTWLYVATVLIEALGLFWLPAKDATVPNLVPRRRLEAANQLSLVATYGTAPLAALIFSGLALFTGVFDNFLSTNAVDLALYVDAASFLVSGLVIARLAIPPRPPVPAARQVSMWRAILDGWKFIGTTPVVRGLILGMLGAFAAAGFVIGLAASFVKDLGGGQPAFGVLFGAVFVGLAAGMWLGPRLLNDLSRRRMFGLALIAAGVFLAFLAVVPNIVMATLFTVAVGACGGVAWVTGLTMLGLEVDDDVRGRTFAFLQSAARIVLVLILAVASTLAGLIGEHTIHFTRHFRLTYNGAAWVFLIAAALAIAMGVTAYRQMDDRPGTPLRRDLAQAWQGRHRAPHHRRVKRAYPGLFVAFEGGDGTGKSTQAALLADWLRDERGHDVVLTREPGATPVGARLREVLLSGKDDLGSRAEALLFAADRAHHVATLVRPALERGAVVVTDRYVDSSIAYQGGGRELVVDDVARLSTWATGGLTPDLTVLLDLPPDVAADRRAADAARAGEDKLESLPADFHARVQERFLDQARREPHRYLVLDARCDVMAIQEAVRRRVRELVPISAAHRALLESRLDAEEQRRRGQVGAQTQRELEEEAGLRAMASTAVLPGVDLMPEPIVLSVGRASTDPPATTTPDTSAPPTTADTDTAQAEQATVERRPAADLGEEIPGTGEGAT